MSVLQPRSDGRVFGATLRERILLFSLPIESGCWIWQRGLDDKGYPRLRVRELSEQYAHRASYIEFRGPLSNNLTVDHLCFTPSCVNPAHLEAVPNEVNAARQRSALSGYCKRGHEFSEENTYWRTASNGNSHRTCRICLRASNRARREARNVAS